MMNMNRKLAKYIEPFSDFFNILQNFLVFTKYLENIIVYTQLKLTKQKSPNRFMRVNVL